MKHGEINISNINYSLEGMDIADNFLSTLKESMSRSVNFKYIIFGCAGCLALGLLLCIIFPFTQCQYRQEISAPCDYYPYLNECSSHGKQFCCLNRHRCNNSEQCIRKPFMTLQMEQNCGGVLVSGIFLVLAGLILAILALIMLFVGRKQLAQGGYVDMDHKSEGRNSLKQYNETNSVPIELIQKEKKSQYPIL